MSAGSNKLSLTEARDLGEERESWCAVERKKEQDWCRKERKHTKELWESCVFQEHKPEYEPRCTFAVDAPTHRERRHFKKQHETQLKI